MAKRNIPKTDPQNTSTSDTKRRAATRSQGAADQPTLRAPRARRRSDAAQGTAAEAASPVTNAAASAAVSGPPSAVRVVEVTLPAGTVPHEHIAVRAYHIYLERGGRSGDEFEDWITAERQLRELTSGHRSR